MAHTLTGSGNTKEKLPTNHCNLCAQSLKSLLTKYIKALHYRQKNLNSIDLSFDLSQIKIRKNSGCKSQLFLHFFVNFNLNLISKLLLPQLKCKNVTKRDLRKLSSKKMDRPVRKYFKKLLLRTSAERKDIEF